VTHGREIDALTTGPKLLILLD